MNSMVVSDRAQRRVNEFQQRCGEYGEAALHLAYHAALPVALNAELLHLLRINFFLDPPEVLPYTVEFEFLLSPLCREIDEGLYEIEPEIRDVLLAGLTQTYGTERTRDIATLLWQYVERQDAWADRVELERAQQLTALNFFNPEKAQQWLATVETEVSQGQVAAREWFIAMQQEIENQLQLRQEKEAEAISALLRALQSANDGIRRDAVEALGRIGSAEAVPALLNALQDAASDVRQSAARALGQIGSTEAIPALLSALQDQNTDVRLHATEALKKINHDGVTDALVDNAVAQLSQTNFVASLRSLSSSQVWTFRSEVMHIGRSIDNDLILSPDDPGTSRQHAEIFHRRSPGDISQSTYFLRDFSRFGTWVLTPQTREWQKVHNQEVLLSSGIQIKFGSLNSSVLEFSIVDPEVIRQQMVILRQFQGSLEHGRKVAVWLDTNRTHLAKAAGELALEQFLDVKKTASLKQINAFYFSIEQYLERISHSLTWGRYDVLDSSEVPLVLDYQVYEITLKKILRMIPRHLGKDAHEQFINCLNYLIESLRQAERNLEKEQSNKVVPLRKW